MKTEYLARQSAHGSRRHCGGNASAENRAPGIVKPLRRWLVPLSFALLLSACGGDGASTPSATTDYTELQREVSRSTEAGMAALQVRGLSIALVDSEKIVWTQGFGMADVAAGTRADADTLYETGSLSKLFTATAVMQQVENGRLQLDRPIDEAIPGFSIRPRFAGAGPITLRNLLTHHSGLPTGMWQGGFAAAPASLAEQVARLANEYPVHAPDQVSAYSNIGFTVLGRAVEVSSGLDFATYMDQRVLAPLGMTSSAFRPATGLAHRMAKGYGSLASADDPPVWLDRDVAAGGLRSSVKDMSQFVMAMLNDGKRNGAALLRPASIGEMWRRQNAGVALDFDTRIGLAWVLDELPTTDGRSVRIVWHDGATSYQRAHLALLPDYGLGVVVLANTDGAEGLVGQIAVDTLRRALKAKRGINLADNPPAAPAARPVTRTDDDLLALTGLYVMEDGNSTALQIAPSGGRLFLKSGDQYVLMLEPHERGLFKSHSMASCAALGCPAVGSPADSEIEAGDWYSFMKVGQHDILVRHSGEKRYLAGSRVEPYALSDAWRRRLGPYTIPAGQPREQIDMVDLFEVGGFLVMQVTAPRLGADPVSLVLRPESENLASIAGIKSSQVVRFGQDQQGEYIVAAGILLRPAMMYAQSRAGAPFKTLPVPK